MGSYCPICDKSFSKDGYAESSGHIQSKAHQTALQKSQGGIKSTKTNKKASVNENYFPLSAKYSSPDTEVKILHLEKRVSELETQMKFIITKYRNLSAGMTATQVQIDTDALKRAILKIVQVERQISSDQLYEHPQLNRFSFSDIEDAVMDLSANGFIDLGEGRSDRKIRGKFGLVVIR